MFRQKARTLMKRWAAEHLHLVSAETFEQFVKFNHDPGLLDNDATLRAALLDFIVDFANWDNAVNPHYLETARSLTKAGHEALGGASGSLPFVVDPFAGGGAIPLEALRVGAEAFASDLNPVAVLLNKVLIEYTPRYGAKLAREVRYWSEQIRKEAESKLGRYFPEGSDGSTPIAYLWARTVISEAPGQGEIAVEIPLLRSMWLAKGSGGNRAFRWTRDASGTIQTEIAEITYQDGKTLTVCRPILEIFAPRRASDVGSGTSAGGAATCPITGYTMSVESVRRQLNARNGGASDARMVCVVTTSPSNLGRTYRLPTGRDIDAAEEAHDELQRMISEHDQGVPVVPNEPLNHLRGFFNVVLYGMTTWGSLFNSRQLLILIWLTDIIKKLRDRGIDDDVGVALQSCLALVIGRMADGNSSLTRWQTARQLISNTFGRQALPMVWDFAEANPFCSATRSLESMFDWIAKVIDHELANHISGTAEAFSATEHVLPNDSSDLLFTDPPYYAAVPYADLSDFFYVWLRRCLKETHPSLFSEALSPKDEELVSLSHRAAMYRQKNSLWFEQGMTKACEEARRIVRPSGGAVVVFASKETPAWEALLTALTEAGWTVTASWPIDTEMGSRLRAQSSAVLASSIHIFCRPREAPDGSLITDSIGDWRDVLEELPRRIHSWLPRLSDERIVGADAIFACLGPALEVFSRYARVEKASGEQVTLREYLEYVWAAVAREALSMIFEGAETTGFEPDARLTAIWLWTLNTAANGGHDGGNEEDESEDENTGRPAKLSGYFLEYDAARKIAQGLGAHLDKLTSVVEVKGDKARLLPAAERASFLFGKEAGQRVGRRHSKPRQLDMFGVIGEAEEAAGVGVASVFRPGETALDRLHQAMLLFAAGRGEALKRFLVEEGVGRDQRLWRLAQALSALYPPHTEEKRWVDGVLARKKGLGL